MKSNVIARRTFLRSTLVAAALLGGAAVIGRHLGGYPAPPRRLRVLSAKEFFILCAALDRLLAADRPDAPRPEQTGAALFIDGYLAKLDVGLQRDLRALLQLLEHGSGLFRLSTARFSHMSAAERDAVLADWESSRLSVRRRGLHALRALAFLGYYRDERTWPMIGYTGPSLPQPGRP